MLNSILCCSCQQYCKISSMFYHNSFNPVQWKRNRDSVMSCERFLFFPIPFYSLVLKEYYIGNISFHDFFVVIYNKPRGLHSFDNACLSACHQMYIYSLITNKKYVRKLFICSKNRSIDICTFFCLYISIYFIYYFYMFICYI